MSLPFFPKCSSVASDFTRVPAIEDAASPLLIHRCSDSQRGLTTDFFWRTRVRSSLFAGIRSDTFCDIGRTIRVWSIYTMSLVIRSSEAYSWGTEVFFSHILKYDIHRLSIRVHKNDLVILIETQGPVHLRIITVSYVYMRRGK